MLRPATFAPRGPWVSTAHLERVDRSCCQGARHHAIVPLTLQDIERAVRAAWSHETTYASEDYLSRAPDRPSRGQCGPTALIVHDLLGGDLLVPDVTVEDVVDGVHY